MNIWFQTNKWGSWAAKIWPYTHSSTKTHIMQSPHILFNVVMLKSSFGLWHMKSYMRHFFLSIAHIVKFNYFMKRSRRLILFQAILNWINSSSTIQNVSKYGVLFMTRELNIITTRRIITAVSGMCCIHSTRLKLAHITIGFAFPKSQSL